MALSSIAYLGRRTATLLVTRLALAPSNIAVQSLSTMPMPQPPHRYLTSSLLDLSDLNAQIALDEEKRQAAFELSRELGSALAKRKAAAEIGEAGEGGDVDATLGALVARAFESGSDHDRRRNNLSWKVEDYLRHKAYSHFLATGNLLPPSAVPQAGDEEFLAGACIGLSQDLARYAVGRATVRDVASVRLARDLVSDIMDYLLEFDFRNGPLRRKYDGTKYALKSLETILYELSVTGATDGDAKAGEGADGVETKADRMPKQDLDRILLRMQQYDERRENLIKLCRDGQKAAKQSIFALHRGDKEKAAKLLKACEDNVRDDLLPIVNEEPGLRHGSFANVLEEYVEARMFQTWLETGTVLKLSDFEPHIDMDAYFGGLCDLTGEVGRSAVTRGTARDTDGVRRCLETNMSILLSIQSLTRLPPGGGLHKKIEPLRRSVEKLERMMYEMSLTEAAGRAVATEAAEGAAVDT